MPDKKPYETQAVTNLQRYLRQLSHQYSDITAPPIDGIFENVTQKSLTEFQMKSGLSPSGVADRTTWDRLFNAYQESIIAYSPSTPIIVFPRNTADYKISAGDSTIYVVALQYMLRELSRDYGVIFDIEPSGKYDDSTVEAIKYFQLLHGMKQTGEVDKVTWNRITEVYNRRVHEYHQ